MLLRWIPLPLWLGARGYPFIAGAVGLAIVLAGLAIVRRQLKGWTSERLGRLARAVPSRWVVALDHGLSSLDILRQRGQALRLGGWSAVVWGAAILTNLCAMRALHLEAPAISAVLLLLVLQVGISLTTIPATLGLFEYLCVLSLEVFGVGETEAVSFGILLHALVLLPSLVGLVYVASLRREAVWGTPPGQGRDGS